MLTCTCEIENRMMAAAAVNTSLKGLSGKRVASFPGLPWVQCLTVGVRGGLGM